MKKSLFITYTCRREQSRHSLFNQIYTTLKKDKIAFQIIAFAESKEEPILSKSGLNLPTKSIGLDIHKRSSPFVLLREIYKARPDHLLIGGYGHIENWIALFYAIAFRLPVTLWSGAGSDSSESNSKVKKIFKIFFVKNVSNAVAYGSKAKNYLESLSKNKIRIRSGINVSYTALFSKTLARYGRSNDIKKIKSKIQKPIFIFIGRLEKSKGIHFFLNQLTNLPYDKYHTYFVGKGPYSGIIEEKIKNKKINGTFWGLLSQEDVAKRLVESDYYILPTLNDPFSRTLSEAIASGCFVLNSIYDDASYDLVNNGKNGFLFDPKNEKEFSEYLNLFLDDKWIKPSKIEISKSLEYDINHYSSKIIKSIKELL